MAFLVDAQDAAGGLNAPAPHPLAPLTAAEIEAAASAVKAAKGLGVSRQSLSELLNGRNGISADMALRLEKAGWSTAESWLRNQLTYDLWHAKQHAGRLKVTKFSMPEPA